MAKTSLETIDIPTAGGVENPWQDAAAEIAAGKGDGKARIVHVPELTTVKDEDERAKIIGRVTRLLRAAAPEVTIKVRVRKDSLIAWAVDKQARPGAGRKANGDASAK